MNCIFCSKIVLESPIEHIVPESLGNKHYVLTSGIVCKLCNETFSKFENKSITESALSFFRIKNAVKTKKGKPSILKIGGISASGDENFTKNIIKVEGLNNENITNFNPIDGSYDITIPDFHKSEMATAKMLLKIGYESLYKSQRKVFNSHNLSSIKKYLLNENNNDWPFITSHKQLYDFKSIPKFNDKYQLAKMNCRLSFMESNNILLFNFKYDIFNLTINLLERDYTWSKVYFEQDKSTSLYPRHLTIKELR